MINESLPIFSLRRFDFSRVMKTLEFDIKMTGNVLILRILVLSR